MTGRQEVLPESKFIPDGGGGGSEDGSMELIELGRKKTYVTIDDILKIFPEVEACQLEGIFRDLLKAGIPYVDDDTTIEPQDKDLEQEAVSIKKEAEEEASEDNADLEGNYLASADMGDTIGLYFKEAGRVPLLTAQEEVALAKRMEKGRISREALSKEGQNLNADDRENHRIDIEDGWAAHEHLIEANSRLVINVAKKYLGRGVPFEDLIQEGNIGLIRASTKFDYRRGHKFSTYATWWVRQAITRAVADQGRTIRVPVHMGERINKLLQVQHGLTQRLGRDPTVEELAVALDVEPEKVELLLEIAIRPLSLETPIDDEEDSTLGDFIPDKEALDPDDSATHNLLRDDLEEVLSSLPPREARILQLRYGLLDGQSYTLEEVGRKMGVTRERIRQIEAKSLGRLRHPVVRKKLEGYLGFEVKKPARRRRKRERGLSRLGAKVRFVKEKDLLTHFQENQNKSMSPFITEQIRKVDKGWTVKQVERALKGLPGDYPLMLRCLLGVEGYTAHSLREVARVLGKRDVEEVKSEFKKGLVLLQDELKGFKWRD